jgi:diguanylate cyclase (GGDEF)-like protein
MQTGTFIEPEIADTVLKYNRQYTGSTKVSGDTYVSTYIPITGENGLPVGIIGLGTSRADIDKVLVRIIFSIAVFTFTAVSVLFIISYIYITRMISDPIILVSKSLMKISKRELDISGINFKRTVDDEISDLNHSLINMVDAIKEYESKLEYAAFYDSMTNLPNKRMLYKNYSCIKYFQHGEIHCDDSDEGCSCFVSEDRIGVVFYLNTGNLKTINDIFGHHAGDLLLIETGIRLKQVTRLYAGEAFRLGGDEFIICLKKMERREQIIRFADEIIKSMQVPFNIRGNVINVSISIGISLCPENGSNINELLKNADIAMNKAKEKGGNTYVFYNYSMMLELQNKVEMELALKRSISNNEFELYFQPKYNIRNKKIEGFEALIRWQIAEGGFISPDIFIPLAEQTGCIIPLGDWIMKKSFSFIKKLNDIKGNNYVISINVSVAQIMQDNFLSSINSIMYEFDIDPKFIEFEITETVLIQSFNIVNEKLIILKEAGFGIVLDDFGKGYSSLSYLKMLPLTTVKLDKTFIDDMDNPEMVNDIIRIAHRMGLKIVAEGVETREQYELLICYDCDYIQGYYISTPLMEDQLIEVLKRTD